MNNVLAYADTLKEALQKRHPSILIMHERRNRMLSLMDEFEKPMGVWRCVLTWTLIWFICSDAHIVQCGALRTTIDGTGAGHSS